MSKADALPPTSGTALERHVLRTLARIHREEPLSGDVRTDVLVARALEGAVDRRPASHRGATPLRLDATVLRTTIDDLVTRGRLERLGHRVRLAAHRPRLGAEMRRRADLLLADLRRGRAAPAPVGKLARQLGLPEAVVEFLRRSGELVAVAPGIDYPADVLEELRDRAVRLIESEGPLTVPRYRESIGSSRRYAVALLEWFDGAAVTRREGDVRVLA